MKLSTPCTTTSIEDFAKVLASDSEKSGECAKNSNTPRRLGWSENSEPRMFDKETEEEGCRKIIQALTEEELQAMPDGNMPMRHLRADKGDIKKAIKRIKYAIKWRQDFGVEKILRAASNPATEEEDKIRSILLKESYPGKLYIRNYDKEKRAIMYMFPCRENTNHPQNNIIHLVYQIERAIACTEKNGLEKMVIIMDFEGWKMKDSAPMATTKQTIHILQECYVERLSRVYFTNPPLVFRTFWNMVKPFLDPVTKAKLVFCTGKAGLKELKQKFDESNVEPCALGTKDLRPFDVDEYYRTPLNTTFDEQQK